MGVRSLKCCSKDKWNTTTNKTLTELKTRPLVHPSVRPTIRPSVPLLLKRAVTTSSDINEFSKTDNFHRVAIIFINFETLNSGRRER